MKFIHQNYYVDLNIRARNQCITLILESNDENTKTWVEFEYKCVYLLLNQRFVLIDLFVLNIFVVD